jgi:7tm Chemosensory receptor
MWSSMSTTPFWLLFQLFGVYPLPRPTKTATDQKRLFFTVWFCALVLVSTLILVYTYLYRRVILYSEDDIGYVNEMLKYGSLVVNSYVILGEMLAKRANHTNIWTIMSRIRYHGKLEQLGQEMNKRYALKFYVFFVTFVLVEIRVGAGTLAIEAYPWFRLWLVSLLPLMICRMMCLLHIYYIDLLASHLRFIRQELNEIVKYSQYSMYVKVDRRYLTDRLMALKDMYGLLYDTMDEVNGIFTWSEEANFTRIFLQCICDLHWFYKTFDHDFPIMIFSFVPLVVCFGSLIYAANACTQQAKSLLPLLHHIKYDNVEEIALSRLIQQFSIQLGHENFRFCGYDLYSIDYGLLKTVRT